MTSLAAAIQLLLVTPAFVRRAFTPREMGASIAFFPLVGLLLGGLLAAVDALLAIMVPGTLRSVLILAAWLILTGGLHFDGLLDACDGLLGGDTPERRLEIMRDERVGAFGVAAGVLALLAAYSALNVVRDPRWAGLVLAPVIGRCAIALSVVTYPYSRASGLGRDMKDMARASHAAVAIVTTLAVAVAVGWQQGFMLAAAALTGAAIVWRASAAFAIRRIGGLTGDIYGAINMLVEVTVLMVWAALA